MSNLRFNLRIWRLHLQIEKGSWCPKLLWNNIHMKNKTIVQRYE